MYRRRLLRNYLYPYRRQVWKYVHQYRRPQKYLQQYRRRMRHYSPEQAAPSTSTVAEEAVLWLQQPSTPAYEVSPSWTGIWKLWR